MIQPSGVAYFAGALTLGGIFLHCSARFAKHRTNIAARQLLLVSILHLPAMFALLGRNEALNANNFFANATGVPKGQFSRHQPGGTLGGPSGWRPNSPDLAGHRCSGLSSDTGYTLRDRVAVTAGGPRDGSIGLCPNDPSSGRR